MINWTRKIEIVKMRVSYDDVYAIRRQPFFTFNAPSYLYLHAFQKDNKVKWRHISLIKQYPSLSTTTDFEEIKLAYTRLISGQYKLHSDRLNEEVIEYGKVEAILTGD